MCKLAFTQHNSPSAHTLKVYVFQTTLTGLILIHTTQAITSQGKGMHHTWLHNAQGEVKLPWAMYDTAWNLHGPVATVLATSSKPCAHSLLPDRNAIKVTGTQPLTGEFYLYLKGIISAPPPKQCTLFCKTRSFLNVALPTLNRSCCIGQSPPAEGFNRLLLTSPLRTLPGVSLLRAG